MPTPEHTNRLIKEKSPYLLQHAHNPVDWYPWGQEAFDLAKNQGKPVFLSIGYATCHWCHVMQKESFQNPEIAKLMNETFVNIKVDREELPEVDSIYMDFAQALMSSVGGWPLNVLLTPDLKPFFAVTYLPPVNRRGLIGMEQFILHIKQLWNSDERHNLLEQADKIVDIFERTAHSTGEKLPSENTVSNAIEVLFEIADPVYGGMKGEPKFPLGYQANFIMEFARAKGDSRALFYVDLTLEMMRRGGIYDQLGGGFSRYSVDEKWMIPHFEKMLYYNAILAKTYLEAWKYIQKEQFQKVCKEILDYLLRDMSSPEGGFYSAEDADSDGREGAFYTWTPMEVREVLGNQETELFCQYYDISAEGNLEGRSVLNIKAAPADFAERAAQPVSELLSRLDKDCAALLRCRNARPRPFKDDKILSSWNGLVIDAMIKAASALSEPRYEEAAIKAAEFIRNRMWKEGRLLRRWREKEARFSAGLDEYAFLIKGVLSLFDEGQGTAWLQWAIAMADVLEKEFKAENGAFYYTDGKEQLLLRKCEYYDGAEPSGNGVHCENLLRLFQITRDDKYLSQAEDILKASMTFMENYAPGACYHLLALQRYLDAKAPTVVVALDDQKSLNDKIKKALSVRFFPHMQVVWKSADDKLLSTLAPILADKVPIDGQTAVYICRQDSCQPPLIDEVEILSAIANL